MSDARTALHQLLRRLFVYTLGYTDTNFFRPDGQRAPAGASDAPYATVKILSTSLESFNMRRYEVTDPDVDPVLPVFAEGEATDLLEVLEALDQVIVSVQFWRDGRVDGAGRAAWGEAAHARASSLVRRLEMSHSIDYANQLGLGYSSASQVRDLSGLVDGSFERRAQVDLTFYVADAEVLALNMFKSATFDVKIQQPDGHISEVSA